MAVSVQNYSMKTVNDRLIRNHITVTAGDDDYACTGFTVPVGTPLTLVCAASVVGTDTTLIKLQGSMDNTNWVTLQTITMDSNLGGTTELAAAGAYAKTHLPATGGDWPYYRLFSDGTQANGSTFKACIIQGQA